MKEEDQVEIHGTVVRCHGSNLKSLIDLQHNPQHMFSTVLNKKVVLKNYSNIIHLITIYMHYSIFTTMLPFYIILGWLFFLCKAALKSCDAQNPKLYKIQHIKKIQLYPGFYTPTLIFWLPLGDGPPWRNLTRPSDVIGCRGVMYSLPSSPEDYGSSLHWCMCQLMSWGIDTFLLNCSAWCPLSPSIL